MFESRSVFFLPAFEKGWQGNPPHIISKSGSSSISIVLTSSCGSNPKLFSSTGFKPLMFLNNKIAYH